MWVAVRLCVLVLVFGGVFDCVCGFVCLPGGVDLAGYVLDGWMFVWMFMCLSVCLCG